MQVVSRRAESHLGVDTEVYTPMWSCSIGAVSGHFKGFRNIPLSLTSVQLKWKALVFLKHRFHLTTISAAQQMLIMGVKTVGRNAVNVMAQGPGDVLSRHLFDLPNSSVAFVEMRVVDVARNNRPGGDLLGPDTPTGIYASEHQTYLIHDQPPSVINKIIVFGSATRQRIELHNPRLTDRVELVGWHAEGHETITSIKRGYNVPAGKNTRTTKETGAVLIQDRMKKIQKA